MADFKAVPVIDVHMDNFLEMWPTIMLALKTSTFVALDTEMSGLGDRKRLNASSVEDRYSAMAAVAKTRSVLSLGISCFRIDHSKQSTDGEHCTEPAASSICDDPFIGDAPDQSSGSSKLTKKLTFVVQTFNILLLCSESYAVDPDSLRFLVGHGFDFNKQYAKGIPYYRGNDYEEKDKEQVGPSIRGLFTTMVQLEVPVVLHNALVDLVFLYQSFYATVPPGLGVFLADLAEIFLGGTYDTKYIAEFQARMPASYLQYVFRRSQRENYARAKQNSPNVCVSFLNYPEEYPNVMYLPCGICDRPPGEANQICSTFAAHGWCKASTKCPMSHDMDLILDNENLMVPVKKRRRIRKRHKQKQSSATDNKAEDAAVQNVSEDKMEVGDEIDHIQNNESVEESSKGSDNLELQQEGEAISAESVMGEEELVIDGKLTETNNHTPSNPREDETDAKSRELNGADEKNDSNFEQDEPNINSTGCHRAGFDAFMTGFIFACFIVQYGHYRILPLGAKLTDFGMQDYTNKITLSGKDIPLQIVKSNFLKTSKEHKAKMNKIRNK